MKSKLVRIENWESPLYEEIERWRSEEFQYGTADCCAFAAACVEVMTGVNPWADQWGGEYGNAREAAALIRAKGHKTLHAVLKSIFGKSCPVSFARTGDIVYKSLGLDAPQIGICLGVNSVSCSPVGVGLIEVPTLELKRAFHV